MDLVIHYLRILQTDHDNHHYREDHLDIPDCIPPDTSAHHFHHPFQGIGREKENSQEVDTSCTTQRYIHKKYI